MGIYLARVFEGTTSSRPERLFYRLAGIDAGTEQTWPVYLRSVLAFSAVSILAVFGLHRLQGVLPGSGSLPGVDPWVAMNNADFVAVNTYWQTYAPEATIGIFVQLVCLIPTTIGALVPADRHRRHGHADSWSSTTCWPPPAAPWRPPETSPRLLLDKTGTITYGNRRAVNFFPANHVDRIRLIEAARVCSLADETPEGRSIVDLAADKGVTGSDLATLELAAPAISPWSPSAPPPA